MICFVDEFNVACGGQVLEALQGFRRVRLHLLQCCAANAEGEVELVRVLVDQGGGCSWVDSICWLRVP